MIIAAGPWTSPGHLWTGQSFNVVGCFIPQALAPHKPIQNPHAADPYAAIDTRQTEVMETASLGQQLVCLVKRVPGQRDGFVYTHDGAHDEAIRLDPKAARDYYDRGKAYFFLIEH